MCSANAKGIYPTLGNKNSQKTDERSSKKGMITCVYKGQGQNGFPGKRLRMSSFERVTVTYKVIISYGFMHH